MTKTVTPEVQKEAKRLRAAGLSYKTIGQQLGFTGTTIHCALDPEFAAARRAQIQRNRKHWRKERREVIAKPRNAAEYACIKSDAAARLAEIPKDTRDLTATILGDPIPNDPRRPWLRGEA